MVAQGASLRKAAEKFGISHSRIGYERKKRLSKSAAAT
jgi:transposase